MYGLRKFFRSELLWKDLKGNVLLHEAVEHKLRQQTLAELHALVEQTKLFLYTVEAQIQERNELQEANDRF